MCQRPPIIQIPQEQRVDTASPSSTVARPVIWGRALVSSSADHLRRPRLGPWTGLNSASSGCIVQRCECLYHSSAVFCFSTAPLLSLRGEVGPTIGVKNGTSYPRLTTPPDHHRRRSGARSSPTRRLLFQAGPAFLTAGQGLQISC